MPDAGPGAYYLEVIGVEVTRQGRGYGQLALVRALEWVVAEADAAGLLLATVLAAADRRHPISHKMLERHGFTRARDDPGEPSTEWYITLETPMQPEN